MFYYLKPEVKSAIVEYEHLVMKYERSKHDKLRHKRQQFLDVKAFNKPAFFDRHFARPSAHISLHIRLAGHTADCVTVGAVTRESVISSGRLRLG